MLGSNDLKTVFHASAKDIADGAGALVDIIKEFTAEKQSFIPKIILISPPEIGEDIEKSTFSRSFDKAAIARSREFPAEYERVAREKGCIFFDAAKVAKPSKEDSLHLDAVSHRRLGEALAELIKGNS